MRLVSVVSVLAVGVVALAATGCTRAPSDSSAGVPLSSSSSSSSSSSDAKSRPEAVAPESGRATLGEPPSFCPDDMAPIDGSYCEKLTQTCLRHRKPWQCAAYEKPSHCDGAETPMRYCIDRYEWPNEKGAMAVVMTSWVDARKQCEAVGKRLCTDAEWTLACEGPNRLAFPYGYERDSVACSIDKKSLKVNEDRLFNKRTQAAELARVDQREASGSRASCVSEDGVHDLTGNVDEWVVNVSGIPYKSALKGGNWGEFRNACRPTTQGHGEGFYYYQIGFRCCRDADALDDTQPEKASR